MLCVWLEKNRLTVRDDIDTPQPASDEALVRVLKAGICQTDLELVNGYYPFTGIPGHEFVGEVVDCPGQRKFVGKRITATINAVCGACYQCRNGRSQHCEKRTVLGIKERHGAFAEYLTVPISNIVSVLDEIPDEAAVFIEPLAAALRIQDQMSITEKDRILVLGAGKLGQLVAQSLVPTGCRLHVAARYPNQKALLEACHISWTAETALPCRHYDVVVEATGSPDGLSMALEAVRPEGTVVLKSTFKGKASVDLSAAVVNEITVIGSRCGRFEPAVSLLKNKDMDPTIFIDRQYPIREALSAFEKAALSGAMKVLLTPKPQPW